MTTVMEKHMALLNRDLSFYAHHIHNNQDDPFLSSRFLQIKDKGRDGKLLIYNPSATHSIIIEDSSFSSDHSYQKKKIFFPYHQPSDSKKWYSQ